MSRAALLERRQVRAAALLAAAIVAAVVLTFAGVPWGSGGYELRAHVNSANGLRTGSEVRIAGVQVGEVARVQASPDGRTSIVTLRVENRGRPVHADATLSIEARLLLEGNFYARLEPGSPGAPELADGATIPLERTAGPVQADQALNVFDGAARDSLTSAFSELATGLGPRDGGDESGHAALRDAVRSLDAALDDIPASARALRGRRPGDLGATLRATSAATEQLARDPAALRAIVVNGATVSTALAAGDRALGRGVRELATTLRVADPALTALDGSLPLLRETAQTLRPVLLRSPAALAPARDLLDQLGRLSTRAELRGLLTDLRPLTARLPALTGDLRTLAPLGTAAATCTSTRVVPTFSEKIEDGPNSTGDPVYLDIAHAFTGAIGAAPTFDANGLSVRAGVTQGEATVNNIFPGFGNFVGGGPEIQGVRPTWLGYGVEPPWRPDQPCSGQPRVDLGARSGGPPAWQRPAGGRRP